MKKLLLRALVLTALMGTMSGCGLLSSIFPMLTSMVTGGAMLTDGGDAAIQLETPAGNDQGAYQAF